jgi:hypothetical protein
VRVRDDVSCSPVGSLADPVRRASRLPRIYPVESHAAQQCSRGASAVTAGPFQFFHGQTVRPALRVLWSRDSNAAPLKQQSNRSSILANPTKGDCSGSLETARTAIMRQPVKQSRSSLVPVTHRQQKNVAPGGREGGGLDRSTTSTLSGQQSAANRTKPPHTFFIPGYAPAPSSRPRSASK